MATMSWMTATVRGLLIVAYFVVATVWLPDKITRLEFIEESSRVVRDVVVSGVWFVALAVGIWVLRRAQRRGLI